MAPGRDLHPQNSQEQSTANTTRGKSHERHPIPVSQRGAQPAASLPSGQFPALGANSRPTAVVTASGGATHERLSDAGITPSGVHAAGQPSAPRSGSWAQMLRCPTPPAALSAPLALDSIIRPPTSSRLPAVLPPRSAVVRSVGQSGEGRKGGNIRDELIAEARRSIVDAMTGMPTPFLESVAQLSTAVCGQVPIMIKSKKICYTPRFTRSRYYNA